MATSDEQRKALQQIPTDGYPQAPAADGSQDSALNTELGRTVVNTANALGPAAGGAASGVIAGVGRLAAGGGRIAQLVANSPRVAAVAPYVPPALGLAGLAAASAPAQSPTPAVSAMPPASAAGAAPVASAPAPAPVAAPQPVISQLGLGGVQKTVGPNGSTLYSDGNATSDASLMARGPISAQNMAAADALAARNDGSTEIRAAQNKALYDQQVADARAINANGVANSQRIEQDMQREKLVKAALDTPSRSRAAATMGLIAGLGQNQAQERTAAAQLGLNQQKLQQDATQQAAGNQIAQAKLGLDTTTAGLDTRGRIQLLAAQDALTNAKTPEERSAAEDNLRALQGKYEKNYAPKFTVVPGGQTIDEKTGMAIREPSMVLDNATGQPIQIAQPKAAPAIAEGTVSTVGNRKAVFTNGKWVPQ